MFNYKFPKWEKKLNTKALSIAATIVYVLSVIPLLVVGCYNWPSADDMSLAYDTYQYYSSTGSLIGTFFRAFSVAFNEYMHWMGYFFSNVMFCYSPSIIGEKWYWLVAFEMLAILTFGVCYFFNALFVHGFKADKHLTNVVAMVTLTVIVQCMPQGTPRVEAFYWYSGAINYMFMLSMGFFWIGLLIRTVYEKNAASRKRKLFWACFWGFWLGGANYMTALELAICSVLVLVIFFMHKAGRADIEVDGEDHRKAFGFIWLPVCFNLIGFMASCFAPGNATRDAIVEGFGAVKSVFVAILYFYRLCLLQYTRWEVWIAMIMLIPVFWKLSEGIRHKFEHPFIFTLFACGMSASNMVPPLYALANLGAGRLVSIAWAEYAVMLVLTVFYWTAWTRQKLGTANVSQDKNAFTAEASGVILICFVFILFGSALSVYVEPEYYSCSCALNDVLSGRASEYLAQNRERLEILQDESVKDAVLEPYSDRPVMVSFDDITEDPDFWINNIMARYYQKDSVRLRGKE